MQEGMPTQDTATMLPGERLVRLETVVQKGFENVKEQLERTQKSFDEFKVDLKDLKDGFVSKDQHNALEARVTTIENNDTWKNRAIVGAVLTSLISGIITVVFAVLLNK